MTGDSTYTGGTTISAGTLQLGNGGTTGSVIGNITNNAHLVFDRGGVYTFTGVISGPGDVTVNGTGVTKFAQTQAYTGATFVESGELRAGAANILGNTSGLTISPLAIFSANGFDETVGNVVNNGIFNLFGIGPDNNITITNLSGNGLFGMITNMASYSGDHIAITGTSSGNHFLTVLNSGDAPADLSRTLELVSTTDSSHGGATFKALGGEVDVGVYAYDIVQGNGSSRLPNTNNWYLAYDQGVVSNSAAAIINTAAAMSDIWFVQMDNLHRRMGQQRLDDPAAEPYDVWVRGYARNLNFDDSVSGQAFSEREEGVDTGIDTVLYHENGNTWIGGFFVGEGEAWRDFNDVGSTGDVITPYAGLYATWFDKSKYYIDIVTKVNRFYNTFNAEDASGNITHADYENWGVGGSVEVGRRFKVGDNGWTVQPQAQVQYVYITGQDYSTDRGDTVSVDGDNVFQTRIGLEGGKNIPDGKGGIFYPYARVSFIDRVSSGDNITADTLTFDPNVDGPGIEYGAGAIYQMDNQHQGYIAFVASNSEHYTQNWGVNLGFRYEF